MVAGKLDILKGLKVLVVEDEPLIAMALVDELEVCGAIVVGPVSSVEQALAAIDSDFPAAAVLDFELRGKRVVPVVDLLSRLAVPFVLTTGYDPAVLPPQYHELPCCAKPATALQVLDMLCTAIARP